MFHDSLYLATVSSHYLMEDNMVRRQKAVANATRHEGSVPSSSTLP